MKSLLALLLLALAAPLGAYDYADDYDSDEWADASLPHVEILSANDFAALSRDARTSGKVIMLEVSASYCGYCRTLEEEIIKPMLRSGDYERNVLIRKLEIDSYLDIRNFNGEKVTPANLASQYGVFVTPTLIFLDGRGREVSERILGVNSLDFFGAYVDEALQEGHRKIQQNLSLNEHSTQ